MLAELVRLTTSDGKVHYGAFYAPRKRRPSRPALVLVHGMTGSFIGEIESAIPPVLAEAGIPVFVSNNRGNGLLGAATESVAGVLPDIAAALDDMQARGYGRLALVGHSKGGGKVAYYQSQTQDPRVVALGLLSPIDSFHNTPQWLATQFGGDDPQKWLKKAIRRAEKGKGQRLYTDRAWPYLVSADTLADMAAATQDDVLENLQRIPLPTLAACGSLELEWCRVVATLRSGAPSGCRVRVVEGADHVYTGKERELADLLLSWLESI